MSVALVLNVLFLPLKTEKVEGDSFGAPIVYFLFRILIVVIHVHDLS